ncbi:MAG: sigma-70 family RNA polymerase sigma factor [Bryobacterales bacterium]|nr:sigma-70 family RNA polymerase sigma factor [Bryobacterales bacterium]
MGAPTSSFDLVARVKGGDRDAFSGLFDKYRRRLAVLIYYKLGQDLRVSIEIDDIIQETMLRAWRDIGQFHYRAAGSFMSWLASIATHVIIDAVRHDGRDRRRATAVVPLSQAPEAADTRTPSRLLSQKEGAAALIERLNALPDDYRQAILLAKIEGLSTPELAERMGRSREAAALLLHRAIKRFRTLRDDV